MLPLLSAAQMRQCDEYTMTHKGIPSRTLMERAARAAIELLKRELAPTHATKFVILCGGGNNGGDGFAMARFLREEGHAVTVCYGGAWEDDRPVSSRMSVECARQYELWNAPSGRTINTLPPLPEKNAIIVDALFGIGLDRPVSGKAAEWICAVNQSNLPVLAVDIPSGICADTGRVMGTAIRATVTATMACAKAGLLLYPGAAHAGKVKVCDIGITTEALEETNCYWVTESDLAPLLARPAYANKGTFGRVLVIGGFPGMCGAPYFAAKTAYRAGAGLVEILSAEDNRIPLQTLIPEAVFTPFDPDSIMSDPLLSAILSRADAVVLGCGLGQSEHARMLTQQVLRLCQVPLVLDADALNLLAAHKPLQAALAARTAPTVLTPHLGEASRLCGHSIPQVASDLFATADLLSSQYHATCVLKDARTVVSDGTTRYIQRHGNSGMATGGSGDCLAGLVASLFAQHRTNADLTPAQIAALGVLWHALAGDHAARHLGQHATMASDIADAVGAVAQALTE